MSDFVNKAMDVLGDVRDNPLLDNADDPPETQVDSGGTLGAIADKADDVSDQNQSTND
jgi:hypothetical protein